MPPTLPVATYRVQLQVKFPLKDLKEQLDYLKELGVSTLYASPILTATPGSNHGYDVVNPLQLNPEIVNSEEEWNEFHAQSSQSFAWMQDIVPNHTALHPNNVWLQDLFLNGKESKYYQHFDIAWKHPEQPGQLLLPVLGCPLEEALEQGVISVLREGEEDAQLKIYDNVWPLLKNSSQAGQSLKDLLNLQIYRPDAWYRVNDWINYRRFFTVNELICMRVEDANVFDDVHQRTLQDVQAGKFQYLRIDHVDGLTDPTGYLQRLREVVGPEVGIYVEKILEPGEQTPSDWPIQGTTGYDFLAAVNLLLTNDHSHEVFSAFYEEITKKPLPNYKEMVFRNKLMLVREHFHGELNNLCAHWKSVLPAELYNEQFADTLAHFLAAFPVYRVYPSGGRLTPEELVHCQEAALQVSQFAPEQSVPVLAFIQWMSQTDFQGYPLEVMQRTQQLSGPLMAKGVEDTTFYQFYRQAHLNEVGGTADPCDRMRVRDFHQFIQSRPSTTMNATSTHDTKRGEDARAILQAVSFYPNEWKSFVHSVQENVDVSRIAPEAFYLMIQSIVGSYPVDETLEESNLASRLSDYLVKALREGKILSGWDKPNTEVEEATCQLAKDILSHSLLQEKLRAFLDTIWPQARHNSLVQVVLKCTVPGFPDIFQGAEGWEQSLVDPDNRRLVCYSKRREWLSATASEDSHSAAVKQQVLRALLQLRARYLDFFTQADYQPVLGDDDALTFQRVHNSQRLHVVIGRNASYVASAPEGEWKRVMPDGVDSAVGVWFQE